MKIIGISGKAGSGKDSIGDVLAGAHGFYQMSFAGILKKAAQGVFSLSDDQLFGDQKEVRDDFWQMTPRTILQQFGTEAMRKTFGEDIWIKTLRRFIDSRPDIQRIVITDVRFPNEAEAVKEWGGELWRVERPHNPYLELFHVSEMALDDWDDWDAVIRNKGSLGDLKKQLGRLLEE